jgi:tetratricopeptide (TPR) repeat protein
MKMPTLDQLMGLPNLTGIADEEALTSVGLLIDLAFDDRLDAGLDRALLLLDELRLRGLTPEHATIVWYFTGNAWSARRILASTTANAEWLWENPAAYQEVLAFRRALNHAGFSSLDRARRCQILTNLGSLMSNLGRFVEALDYYDRALGLNSTFGMALGNKGQCLLAYARALYDDGHKTVLASEVARLLERAVQLPLEPGAREGFAELLDVAQRASSGSEFARHPERLRAFDLGDGEEAVFRTWALERRLFLNPLNDLGALEIAARDTLHLPEIQVSAQHGTGFHGFFNQLKQEFAAARVLLFESLQADRHYADAGIRLVNTLDGTAFGLSLEKTKFAFRSAYSILDKAAVFVALYFNLAVPLHRVTFRSVWFTNGRADRGLRPEFENRKNWPLRGLYWLAKDLAEEDTDFHDAMDPDAQETATLRNRLEHQYVKVTSGDAPDAGVPPDPFPYRIDAVRLLERTARALSTARAALTYLSLAVHAEERTKASPSPSGSGTFRGSLPIIE